MTLFDLLFAMLPDHGFDLTRNMILQSIDFKKPCKETAHPHLVDGVYSTRMF